CQHFWGTPFTF
nr:immunoglobulin light chain junction region [Mus musculus]NSM01633.1 immunoglobulin light chain junction region [Mus musculus]NSM02085.1 immunoglobulin light chain junction region [Mus musculus]